MPTDHRVFDLRGNPSDLVPDPEWGPAVLLVEPVTDALKQVSAGRVKGSLDRESARSVVGYALTGEVLALIGSLPARPRDVLRAVVSLGYSWEASPVNPSSL